LKQLDPTQVELEIPISSEEFDKAQDAAFRKLVRSAKIPGFRPGKVPRKIFENTYGTSAILDEALERLVPAKYAEAVKEHELEPLARPEMELLPEVEGQPLRVKALVSVRPPIEPAPYDGIEVEDVSEKAGDDDMAQAIETMRKNAATLVPVERPVQLGDTATIDYAGKIYLTRGDVLWSNDSRPMFTILEDDVGRHDFLLTPCSQEMFEILYRHQGHHPSCFENLCHAFEPYGIRPEQISTTFNIFMRVDVAADGAVAVKPPLSKAGDRLELRAEMDLICALTACSAEGSNNGTFKPIDFEILPAGAA